jgi:hypothetical protein
LPDRPCKGVTDTSSSILEAALFDYGEVELSNNLVENPMRPVALGRKNARTDCTWGCVQAHAKLRILSVVE